jgi:hypothetical protein
LRTKEDYFIGNCIHDKPISPRICFWCDDWCAIGIPSDCSDKAIKPDSMPILEEIHEIKGVAD